MIIWLFLLLLLLLLALILIVKRKDGANIRKLSKRAVLKRIFRTLIIAIIVTLGLLLMGIWMIIGAFGTKHRTVEIELSNDRKLICEETYSADLAEVFYDVEFVLKEKNKEDINLGKGTFTKEDWDKHIEIIELGDWIILPVAECNYCKILMNNDRLTISKDTIFSPLELRYDKAWRTKYDEIPAWFYGGRSKIDSIKNNKVYVNYEYRSGLYEPFEFYNQSIEYEVDILTGNFETKAIFERSKK